MENFTSLLSMEPRGSYMCHAAMRVAVYLIPKTPFRTRLHPSIGW